MPADDLLRGPRGRRTCWELLGLAPFGLVDLPPVTVTDALRRTIELLGGDGDGAGSRIFAALGRAVDAAMYWQEPDECDQYLSTPRAADLLRPMAEALAVQPRAAWWWTGADLDDQHDVRMVDRAERAAAPRQTGAAVALREWRADVTRQNESMRQIPPETWAMTSGVWWSAPIQSPLRSTTRALPGYGPVGLWLVEDSPGRRAATTWPVRATRAPRIFEITGPDSWAELTRRFALDVSAARGPDWYRLTGRRGRWLIPDWQAAAGELDAVHLTVAGYLSAAGNAVALDGDAASTIAGWAPDQTYWLADLLEPAGSPAGWRYDEDAEVWQPTAPPS